MRRASSAVVGWLADRRVPRVLRRGIYGGYCRLTGADPREAELPLGDYPSLGAFFVRRLRPGARPIEGEPHALVAPCDGTLQATGVVAQGTLLQAKGHEYPVAELLGTSDEELEGAWTATIYLSPRDYHRVHAPLGARLASIRWIPGERRSVAAGVLARVPRVLATNERAVLELRGEHTRVWLVMVGALNVGRIRIVGVEPGCAPPAGCAFERGAELARFELGSTVVLVVPGARPVPGFEPGRPVRLGERIAALP